MEKVVTSLSQNKFFLEGREMAKQGKVPPFNNPDVYWVKRMVSQADYNGWYKFNNSYTLLEVERAGKAITGVWIGFLSTFKSGKYGTDIPLTDEEKYKVYKHFEICNILPRPLLPKDFKSNCKNGYQYREDTKAVEKIEDQEEKEILPEHLNFD